MVLKYDSESGDAKQQLIETREHKLMVSHTLKERAQTHGKPHSKRKSTNSW